MTSLNIDAPRQQILAKLFLNCNITDDDITEALALSRSIPDQYKGLPEKFSLQEYLEALARVSVKVFLRCTVLSMVRKNIPLISKSVVEKEFSHLVKSEDREPLRQYFEDVLVRNHGGLKKCLEPFSRGIDLDVLLNDEEGKHANVLKWAIFVTSSVAVDACRSLLGRPSMYWDTIEENFRALRKTPVGELVDFTLEDIPSPVAHTC